MRVQRVTWAPGAPQEALEKEPHVVFRFELGFIRFGTSVFETMLFTETPRQSLRVFWNV
jgi:hypothetical protein